MSLRLKVIDGTPFHGNKSLCFSCRYSHIFQGQAISDLTVRCEAHYDNSIYIKRPVVDCNEYSAKTNATKTEMEKIGWVLETKRGKPLGFFHPADHKTRVGKDGIDKHEDDSE